MGVGTVERTAWSQGQVFGSLDRGGCQDQNLLTGLGLAWRNCRALPEMELGDRKWGTGLEPRVTSSPKTQTTFPPASTSGLQRGV